MWRNDNEMRRRQVAEREYLQTTIERTGEIYCKRSAIRQEIDFWSPVAGTGSGM